MLPSTLVLMRHARLEPKYQVEANKVFNYRAPDSRSTNMINDSQEREHDKSMSTQALSP